MERQTITGSLSTSGRLSGALSVGGGTTDYNELENKPTYNGHVIEGDMTNESLGIWQPKNFSTEEQNIGIKWIDGKDLYQITFKIENITINTTYGINVDDLNIDTGFGIHDMTTYKLVSPEVWRQDMTVMYESGTNNYVYVITPISRNVKELYVTLRYTKN